jgi:hypothetical protein
VNLDDVAREVWYLAELRPGMRGRRYIDGGEEVWVRGFAISPFRGKDGAVSDDCMLWELDEDGEVLDDWYALDLTHAKEIAAQQAASEACEPLVWEHVPDVPQVSAYFRALLRKGA